MFIEANGRFDALIKIFGYYPEKAVRYTAKKKGKIIVRFLITETNLKIRTI